MFFVAVISVIFSWDNLSRIYKRAGKVGKVGKAGEAGEEKKVFYQEKIGQIQVVIIEMNKLVSSLFKLSRKDKEDKEINSGGNCKYKLARRLKNKILGRRLIRKIQ